MLDISNLLKEGFVASWKKRLSLVTGAGSDGPFGNREEGGMVFRVLSKTKESRLFVHLMFNISLVSSSQSFVAMAAIQCKCG